MDSIDVYIQTPSTRIDCESLNCLPDFIFSRSFREAISSKVASLENRGYQTLAYQTGGRRHYWNIIRKANRNSLNEGAIERKRGVTAKNQGTGGIGRRSLHQRTEILMAAVVFLELERNQDERLNIKP